MIDYYTAKELGGNTRKISIMLAETGLEHVVHFIDLRRAFSGRIGTLISIPTAGYPRLSIMTSSGDIVSASPARS